MPPTGALADESHVRMGTQRQARRTAAVKWGRRTRVGIGNGPGKLHLLFIVVIIECRRQTGLYGRNENGQRVDQKFVQRGKRSCAK